MLVLKRRVDEVVVIRTPHGDVIEVMVCELDFGMARLGVKADPDTIIWRKELGEFHRTSSRDGAGRMPAPQRRAEAG